MSGDWVACPHCGERIKRDARSCRHCGSDDSTGWSESTYMDGIDIPDDGDYADGMEREGFRRPNAGAGRWLTGTVAAILILLFALWLLRGVL